MTAKKPSTVPVRTALRNLKGSRGGGFLPGGFDICLDIRNSFESCLRRSYTLADEPFLNMAKTPLRIAVAYKILDAIIRQENDNQIRVKRSSSRGGKAAVAIQGNAL